MNAVPPTTRSPGIPAAAWRRGPAGQAFTLIELLLAIAIFSLVLSAISGVFYGAMRLRTRTSEAIEEALPVQRALAILRKDLAGIVLPRGTIQSNLVVAAGSGEGSVQDSDTAIYTSSAAVSPNLPWGEVQRVWYGLRPPTNAYASYGKDLVRFVVRNPLPVLQDDVDEQHILGGVLRLEFSFYDGTTWQTSWNTSNQTAVLPAAVKVLLTMADNPARRVPGASTGPGQAPFQVVVPILLGATNAASTTDSTGGGQP